MFEVPTNARSREAIRLAHSERARVFAEILGFVTHPFRHVR